MSWRSAMAGSCTPTASRARSERHAWRRGGAPCNAVASCAAAWLTSLRCALRLGRRRRVIDRDGELGAEHALQRAECVRQPAIRRVALGDDPQRHAARGPGPYVLLELEQLGEHRSRTDDEPAARRGQRQAARLAVAQAGTELVLDREQPAAYRRLGEVEGGGRAYGATRLREREDERQLGDLEGRLATSNALHASCISELSVLSIRALCGELERPRVRRRVCDRLV